MPVVELRLMEARIGGGMADLAGGRETGRGMVRIPRFPVVLEMAGGAIGARSLERLVFVAGVATDGAVGGIERKPRLRRMVPLDGGPGRRPVAFFALRTQPRPVAVILPPDPMAVVAIAGRSLDLPIEMAGGAGHAEVPAFERKRRRLMESPFGIRPAGRGMALRAGFLHGPLVGIPVAGRAGGRQGHERTRLMAALTGCVEGGVFSREGESRFFRVIERFSIQRSEIDVGTLMLDVADLAIAGHVPVDALLGRDALGHRGMAREALVRIDRLPHGVAFLAIGRPGQCGVGRGQLSRRRLGRGSDGESPP